MTESCLPSVLEPPMNADKRRSLISNALLLLLTLVIPLFPQDKPGRTPAEEHRLDVQSFEYVWKTVLDKHFDPDFGGADWPAVREEFLPKVEAATSRVEARRLMQLMLSRLKLTHFAIFPSDLYETLSEGGRRSTISGWAGFYARAVDGHVLVTRVGRGSPAEAAGVRPGWEVLRVRDRNLDTLLASAAKEYEGTPWKESVQSAVAHSVLRGTSGEKVAFRFLNGDGRPVGHSLDLVEPEGNKFRLGHIPPIYVRINTSRLHRTIGYIAFNQFLDPATVMPAFNDAMSSFMDTDGIIIDVRGNPGGQAEMITGMAGWFIREKGLHLGIVEMRDARLKLIVRPRPQVYDGPLAILVDGLSTCASEILAMGLREAGRATIFGTRTGGAALGSAIERLPNGDGFQYAYANFTTASRNILEGNGVIPDVEVQHTRKALLQGRDLMLEAAVNWIKDRRRSGPTTGFIYK